MRPRSPFHRTLSNIDVIPPLPGQNVPHSINPLFRIVDKQRLTGSATGAHRQARRLAADRALVECTEVLLSSVSATDAEIGVQEQTRHMVFCRFRLRRMYET
jgi:hypothetical protein